MGKANLIIIVDSDLGIADVVSCLDHIIIFSSDCVNIRTSLIVILGLIITIITIIALPSLPHEHRDFS